jgi:hypothetical protein
MDQKRYHEYLIEFTKEALDSTDGTPQGASNYLSTLKKPGILARQEKKEAFRRAKKVFAEMRDRPLWLVLKALGLSVEDVESKV